MRLAVFSDIHGNLTAMEAMLPDLLATQPDIIWYLGDLAAFGARPAECIQRLRELSESFGKEKFHVIGGNTDRYLVNGDRPHTPTLKDEEAFKRQARFWRSRDNGLNWGVDQLSWEDYEYLAKICGRELSQEAEGYGWVIGYHAVPGSDEPALGPDTPAEEARDYLLDREGRLGIGGHIHVQMDRDLGDWRVVNVGSVGMGFTKPGHAEWGLFTFENGQVTVDLRKVPYDLDAAIADLQAVGYPEVDWWTAGVRRS